MSGGSPIQASRERQALAAIRTLRSRLDDALRAKSEPIAIIGLSCRFPGAANDAAGYWRLLSDGDDGVRPIPPERFDLGPIFDARREVMGKTYSRWAGLVDDVDGFDAEFFGISPREAESMDPQQRLFLEGSWLALEHAGIAPTSLVGSNTGVFVGVTSSEYARLHDQIVAAEDIGSYCIQGLSANAIVGRVSYTLGLQGPALAIDTACSSSLVALDRACRSLCETECDLAIAGGVNVIVMPEGLIAGSQIGMFASDGRCKSFSGEGDGFVRGEGCGVVVLKRLRDAVGCGDRVLAVIRGSAVNHDGASSGLTVPNGLAQEAVLRRALQAARVAPSEVGYVEAHGTGTSLGDPIEAAALGRVLGEGRSSEQPLLIGSVKTNIGHLEAAAGVAGLIKVVLALGHGALPGQLHWRTPSPHIRWAELKLQVVDRLRTWAPINGRRIAGVSAFGFSGTNAHMVVEEAPPPEAELTTRAGRPVEILPISAKNARALQALAERYSDRLQEASSVTAWSDLCHSAAVGRGQFGHRLSVRGDSAAAAGAALAAYLAQQPHPAVSAGEVGSARPPRVGFLFTGQGSQYAGMGAALYAHSPRFRQIVDQAETVLAKQLAVPLGAVMRGEHPQAATLIHQTLYTQPALYVLEYGLAALWQSLGVQPVAVLGHSLGEYVGCAVAGVFGFEEGLRLVADRARLMHELSSDGAMVVVAASEAEVAGLLVGREAEVSLAGVNAARQVTLSGARRAIEALAADCAARGWRSQVLPVSQAFHSPLMTPIGEAFEARAGAIAYEAPRLPVISNLNGAVLETVSATYWRRHMREAVRFSAGMETLHALGCDVLIELGPRPVLIQLARQAAVKSAPPRRYLTSLKGPGTDEWDTLSQAVQELYVAGAALDWSGWDRDYPRRKVDVPRYPFERRRHWLSPSVSKLSSPAAGVVARAAHPLLGHRLRSALPGGQFEAVLNIAGETAWLGDHRIAEQTILPVTGMIEIMLAAGQALDSRWGALEGLSITAPLVFAAAGARTVQTLVEEAQDGRARVRLFAGLADASGAEASVAADGQLGFRLHAEALLAAAPAFAGEGQSDLAALRERCPRRIDGDVHYRQLAARGAAFGPTFRGVQQLWAGADEALGEIAVSLPSLAVGRPHPTVLDACLQVAAAALPDSADTFLPVALNRFTWFVHDEARNLIVHASRVGDDPNNPAFDLTIHDPQGKILGRFDHVQFRKSSAKLENELQSWFYELDWDAAPMPEAVGQRRAAWLVIGAGAVARRVAAALEASGQSVTFCAAENAAVETALAVRHIERGIIYVPAAPEGDLDEAGPMSGKSGVEDLLQLGRLHFERGLLAHARLYVVTRKAHAIRKRAAVSLTDAALSGLAATLFNEFPELSCTRIDIDPTDGESVGDQIASEALADAPEDWVAYRDGRRFVGRVHRALDMNLTVGGQDPVFLDSDNGFDGLRWLPMPPRALAPNDVEIDVHAAPLNFHDVVSVAGLILDQSRLGGECAGVVTRVGPAVERFKPGDAVVTITPGSFATFAVAPEARVIAKPAKLSFAAAAAQGIVYLTADYCLNNIAAVRAGERVLIHAATGGVGLAAIQLCRCAGAEIYATAGSEAKRALLREMGIKHVFPSRSLEFVEQVLTATSGEGIDIVLNSLAGEFVDASLSLLRPGGRFIEIGKTDIRVQAEVVAAYPGVVYEAIDLTDRLREEPEETLARLASLLDEMAAGELKPVPHRVYGFDNSKDAFRELAAARHIGKLVLIPDSRRALVREEGTYIVTGGAAGIGFAAAEWLAEQRAGRVILLSRHPPDPEIAARIAQWREKDVDIVAIQGDVGDMATVRAVVADAGLALCGVIHCANVLDDAPVGRLTWDRFETVLRPKALGAWHLHQATMFHSLDFFVLFSSWAAIAGTRGGANYAAANVALDSLAHQRHHQNLPALSLDWGVWADIGWAARVGATVPTWPGFDAMQPKQALKAMSSAMRYARSPQLAIAPIDWQRLAAAFGPSSARVWSDLIKPNRLRVAPTSDTAASVAKAIADSSPSTVRPTVVSQLQRMAAATLGVDDPLMIDPDKPLQDLGLDSILAVDLRNTLARVLDEALPATLLFDHPTINRLADYSIGVILPKQAAAAPKPGHEAGDDLLALIEGLTEDEVDARLVRRATDVATL